MKRRSGWRMLGLIVVGMVLLTIGGGIWWYYDDSDLDAIRSQARQQGSPLIWSDLKLELANAERLRLWQRAIDLGKQVSAFQSQLGPDGKSRYKVWDNIPDAMRTHHAELDPAVIAELTSVLDQLGDQPLVLHDQISYSRLLPEIGQARALLRFMQERLILAESNEVGVWGRRMLALCRRYAVDSLIQHLVYSSLLDATLQGIAYRLPDLKRTDPTIAIAILDTINPQHDQLLRALNGEFVMLLDTLARPGSSHWANDPDAWYMPMVIRAGRYGALCAQLDAIQQLRQMEGRAALVWAKATETTFYDARTGVPYPSLILQSFFMPVWSVVIGQSELVKLRGQLLAAELQGTSWPIDVYDPTSATLRAIQRDGRVIAAYSVHSDGIDNGGDAKKDRVIPLYADPTKP